MNKVWFWHAARLALILGLIVAVRAGIGYAALSHVEAGMDELDAVAVAMDGGMALDEVGTVEVPAEPDPGRAGQIIHTDLEREGQIVVREGRRVVLIDASDPDNEVWMELDQFARSDMPWILRDGWGPIAGSVAGGLGTYLLGWGLFTLLVGKDAGSV